MPEIVYTGTMEIKQLSKQHGRKVSCFLTNGLNSWYVFHVYDDYDYDRVTILPINKMQPGEASDTSYTDFELCDRKLV